MAKSNIEMLIDSFALSEYTGWSKQNRIRKSANLERIYDEPIFFKYGGLLVKPRRPSSKTYSFDVITRAQLEGEQEFCSFHCPFMSTSKKFITVLRAAHLLSPYEVIKWQVGKDTYYVGKDAVFDSNKKVILLKSVLLLFVEKSFIHEKSPLSDYVTKVYIPAFMEMWDGDVIVTDMCNFNADDKTKYFGSKGRDIMMNIKLHNIADIVDNESFSK